MALYVTHHNFAEVYIFEFLPLCVSEILNVESAANREKRVSSADPTFSISDTDV